MTTDWQPITDAQMDGTRLRLGHTGDPSSMKIDSICPVFGHYDERTRQWNLSSIFIVPGGRHGALVSRPTHYLPGAKTDQGPVS